GIRDRNVTGVQTCALPISWHGPRRAIGTRAGKLLERVSRTDVDRAARELAGAVRHGHHRGLQESVDGRRQLLPAVPESHDISVRSEERRVGKGGISRGSE